MTHNIALHDTTEAALLSSREWQFVVNGHILSGIIQYSYYDNEPAGDQFITFIASHHITQSPTKYTPKTDKFLVET